MQNGGVIELAIFDIAGTTVNDPNLVAQCLQSALQNAHIERSIDEINVYMGIPKPIAIAELLGEDTTESLVAEIHENFVEQMLEVYRSHPEVRAIDGAEEVFAELKHSGIKVALDTGFDRQIGQVILDRLGWNETFDATVMSDEVENGRPFPDLVFRAMEITGVADVSRVAKIGDTPSDLHEGTNAGCGQVIGVCYGSHTRAQLSIHPHTALVDSISEVPDLIRS